MLYRFIFYEYYWFKIFNFYLKHNLQIFPILGIFIERCFLSYLLNSFMFFSSIRTICLFRSSISLVPSSPRLGAKVLMTALILFLSFVKPLYFPSITFYNFSAIFSLNSIHFPVLFRLEDPKNVSICIHSLS